LLALKVIIPYGKQYLDLLANAHKLSHLGLSYLVAGARFLKQMARRSSKVFRDIYMSTYRKHAQFLADSRLSDADMRTALYYGFDNHIVV
jgi:hypothetical protein